MESQVRRGEIFFYKDSKFLSGKPVLILNTYLANDGRTMVRYLNITKDSDDIDESIKIKTDVMNADSVIICNNIFMCGESYIGKYIGLVSEEEMQEIENKLFLNLDLQSVNDSIIKRKARIDALTKQVEGHDAEVNQVKAELEEMIDSNAKLSAENSSLKAKLDAKIAAESESAQNKNMIRLTMERDFYKEHYDMLLNRLLKKHLAGGEDEY